MKERLNLPLFGLLAVQLITGMMLMPMNSFLGIYLNEALAFPMRRVAQVIALGQVAGMVASLGGGGLSDRWGKKNVLLTGVAALTVCAALYLFPSSWLVLILWGIGGAGLRRVPRLLPRRRQQPAPPFVRLASCAID